MIHLVEDVRFAYRKYRTAPGPTLTMILTLALGVGANVAIFSLVDGAWLRPLALADPVHLVAIASVKDDASADAERLDTFSSFAELLDVRGGVPALADFIGIDQRGVALETADGIQLLSAEVVSDNFFRFAGVRPEIGRLPDEAEIRGAPTPVIVLSHGTWNRVFAGRQDIIGQIVKTKGGTAAIAAVLPAGFHGTQRIMDPQVYVPRSTWTTWFPGDASAPRTYRNYDLFARLRPGATLQQARAQLQALSTDLAAKYPQTNRGRSFTAGCEQNGASPVIKLLGTMLLAVGAAILLIACTNIANLLLALNDARRREIAMRSALGATRADLVRQLITEYSALAALGIACALLLARQFIALVRSLFPDIEMGIGPDFRIDHRVLIFTAVVGALSVLLCGLLPGLASTRTSPMEAMRAQRVGSKLKMPGGRSSSWLSLPCRWRCW